jgi:inhibitor of cysteine peptidase
MSTSQKGQGISRLSFVLLLVLVLLLSGCAVRVIPLGSSPAHPAQPVSSDDATPTATPSPRGGATVSGQAMVEQIQILFLESFPVQVTAVVSGYLPDGCTRIVDTNVEQQEDSFIVTISTARPADAMCTMALVPFEESISIPVQGLPAGDYTIAANGVTVTFTLDVDNVLTEE